LDEQVAAAPVDNVFGFEPVEMEGSDLIGVNNQDFFGVGFALPGFEVIDAAVADGEEKQPSFW
jgi:hypothetical protein